MSFRADEVLWFLFTLPGLAGLIAFGWHLRRRATHRFGAPETVAGLRVGRPTPWRAARAVLLLLGVALTIVALAGPRFGSRTRVLRDQGIDVVIALDFSKSMLARDVRPSRIERAKAELGRFLEELGGDRVGLVAFAGDTLEFPMTIDHGAVHLFLRNLGPYDMPVGGTAIARALVASKRLLLRSSTPLGEAASPTSKVVILLTDGEDHEGDVVEAARDLAEAGIRVYTVGIGSRTGEPIPTYSPDGTWTGYLRDDDGNAVTTAFTEENEQALEQIARLTGGAHFRAPRGDVGVHAIRAEMQKLKQEEREARHVTLHEERYALVLFPAFLFLVLEALLPEAWLRRRRRSKEGAR